MSRIKSGQNANSQLLHQTKKCGLPIAL